MKKIIFFLFLFCIVEISIAQEQRGIKVINLTINGSSQTLYKESHALVIGMSDYTNGWPKLPGVKNDVNAVKTALEKQDFDVTVLQNVTKEGLDKGISNFISKYGQGSENRLLFYFAGHGHTIKTSYGDELGYIVPIDAPNPNKDTPGFQEKAVEMAQIEIYAKRIQSKHALFLFDACFSGALFSLSRAAPEIINYKTSQPVRQFITSGSASETVPDVSIFRKQFISAITTNDADANKDGYLTGSELGDFIQTTVVNYSYNAQHPQFGKIRSPSLDKGDFVFQLSENSKTNVKNNSVTENVKNNSTTEVGIGTVEEIIQYGSIELTSEISGDLYLDGKKIYTVKANTKIPINNLINGSHNIEIKGTENWQQEITINKDQKTQIIAKATNNSVVLKKDDTELNENTDASTKFTDSRDGKVYKVVKIGTQIWMAENLAYKPNIGNCWAYDNKESNVATYGYLYDWETANKACPKGWHLPSDAEWTQLIDYLGGKGVADGKMKEAGTVHWKIHNKGDDNSSGFTGLPGGYRVNNGTFCAIGNDGVFWSATENSASGAWQRYLKYGSMNPRRNYFNKAFGISVRCIKDI
jgi:uncharacterized protein (TIGR02145 family)